MPWTFFWRVRVEFGIVVLCLAAQNNKWHRVRVLLIECRYLSTFCLVRHSKFAPICLLLKSRDVSQVYCKKRWPKQCDWFLSQNRPKQGLFSVFRPCNDLCMTIKGIFLLSCLMSSYMNQFSSLRPAGCSRTCRCSLQKEPWRISGGRVFDVFLV